MIVGFPLLATPFGRDAVIGCMYLKIPCLVILLCISSVYFHHIDHIYVESSGFNVLLCCV